MAGVADFEPKAKARASELREDMEPPGSFHAGIQTSGGGKHVVVVVIGELNEGRRWIITETRRGRERWQRS